MSTFQEKINAPVDIAAEIKAYEEANPAPEAAEKPPEPDRVGGADESTTTDIEADLESDVEPKQHAGNAWSTMRAKVKAAEERARQVEAEKARLEGEYQAWRTWQQQQYQQPPAQPEPIPDPTLNPIEALQYVTKQQQQQADLIRQQNEYIQQQNLIGEVQRRYRDDANRFMTEKADFRDAYTHAVNGRIRQLQISGATPEQANQQVIREEMELAYNALQAGRSPAQVIYEMAQSYGYQPKAGQATQRDDSGKFVSIDKEQQKAAAATSISRGGTAQPRTSILPPEEAVKLTGTDFDKWFDEYAKQQGGRKIQIR